MIRWIKLTKLILVIVLIIWGIVLPLWMIKLNNFPEVIDTIDMTSKFEAIHINHPEIVPKIKLQLKEIIKEEILHVNEHINNSNNNIIQLVDENSKEIITEKKSTQLQHKEDVFPIGDKEDQEIENSKIDQTNNNQIVKIELPYVDIDEDLVHPELIYLSLTENLNTPTLNINFEGDPLIDETSQKIELLNEKAIIRNFNQFKLEDEFIPITIRVYNRTDDFREMIKAISTVRDIKKTILVFSHDIVNKEIFDLIESIDFCQTIQLLHPYSLTFQRDNYSREYLNLPPVNIPIPKKTSAIKHHFWWLTNYVFAKLFPHHNGDIAFLEEDHLVTKDFYQLLKTMRKIREIECKKQNNDIRKGNFKFNGDFGDCFASVMVELNGNAQEFRFVELTPNIGISFDRNSWNNVLFHSDYFCTFNEYNWDLTLTVMAALGMIPRKNLAPKYARSAHLGVCEGTHHNIDQLTDCKFNRDRVIRSINYKNEIITKSLNGTELEKNYKMAYAITPRPVYYDGFGGWDNPIDWKKCFNVLARVSNITDGNIL